MDLLPPELLRYIFLYLSYGDIFRVRRSAKKYDLLFRDQEYWILRAVQRLDLKDTSEFREFFCLAPNGIRDAEEACEFLNEEGDKIASGMFYKKKPILETDPVKLYLRVLHYGDLIEYNSLTQIELSPLLKMIAKGDILEFEKYLHFVVRSHPGDLQEILQWLLNYASIYMLNQIFLIVLENIGSVPDLNIPCISRLPCEIKEKAIEILHRRKLVKPSFFRLLSKYEKEGLDLLMKLSNHDLNLFSGVLTDEDQIPLISNLSNKAQYKFIKRFALEKRMYLGKYDHLFAAYGVLGEFGENDSICSCFEFYPGLVPLALSRLKKIEKKEKDCLGFYVFYRKVWLAKAIDLGVEVEDISPEIIFLKQNERIRKIILDFFPFPDPPVENPKKIYFTEMSWSLPS